MYLKMNIDSISKSLLYVIHNDASVRSNQTLLDNLRLIVSEVELVSFYKVMYLRVVHKVDIISSKQQFTKSYKIRVCKKSQHILG